MKYFKYLIVLFLMFQAYPAHADGTAEPEKIIKTSISTILTVLGNETLSTNQKQERITTIIDGLFNIPLIGKLCLGKKNWSKFNSREKADYTSLFSEFFKTFYADKIEFFDNEFDNEKVLFEPGIKSGNKIKIPTFLVSKGEKTSMLYKMYNSKKGWRIYDIEIAGVSIIKTYRSQFSQILKKGVPEDLLVKIREKKIAEITYN
ncbi:MAG: ABC transporter substrate-binding protein [Thermodesulfobacteriota bacterium]|nr:ABC transporter substrate-binding protein [Thermodesulfobacteriota bacterium]